MKQGHEKTFRSNGLCRVRVIKELTDEKMEALGITMGDAMMLLDVLHAEAQPQPAAGATGEGRSATVRRRPEMGPFPKCGATRYPDWRVGCLQGGAGTACGTRGGSTG